MAWHCPAPFPLTDSSPPYPSVKEHTTKCPFFAWEGGKRICPNCKMYLSKLQNGFVQITKCICIKYKMNFIAPCLSWRIQQRGLLFMGRNINFKMYLSKLQNVRRPFWAWQRVCVWGKPQQIEIQGENYFCPNLDMEMMLVCTCRIASPVL